VVGGAISAIGSSFTEPQLSIPSVLSSPSQSPSDVVPVFTNGETDLEALLAFDRKTHPTLKVPLLMTKTLEHLFDSGLNTEGLFRVPGNATSMAAVEEEYNAGRGAFLDFRKKNVSCEDAASLLKKFLRESLPDELFTAKLSDKFRAIVGAF